MEDRKVPWWRKALSFALDGIRSGFGLFSKSAKDDAHDEPEIVSAQQEAPEEAKLTRRSREVEPIAAVANEAESVSTDELAAEETTSAEAENINARIEPSESAQPSVTEEVPTSDPGSVTSPFEAKEDAVSPELEAFELIGEAPEPALEAAEDTPVSQPEPAAETEVAAATLDEPIAEPVPEITAEESAEEDVVAADTLAEAEPEEETASEAEIANEPEALPTPAEKLEIAVATSAAIDVDPMKEVEAPVEAFAEPETPVEFASEEETTPEPVADPVETVEQIAEPELTPEMESPLEPVIIEEFVPTEDSVQEPAISSVELSEPDTEEVTAQTSRQTAAGEEESDEEVTPDPEAVPQTEDVSGSVTEDAAEKAAEEVTEEAPEPVIETMELNEPIPEQPTEPAEANETVPVAEGAAGEAIGENAAPESAPEPALASEQSEVEQPQVELPESELAEPELGEVEAAMAEAVPAAMTSVAAATEAAVEDESTPGPALPPPPQKPFIKLESRDNEADLSPFSVIVSQVYDGPLDLLLDLIRKQDIDIYDIPIARITAQFLAYVNQLKATDVDVAGEFIYTASLLIHIKSKMLLPRAPSGQDDAAEDPRRELVERLLEHERFKNAAQMLQQKQMLEAASWTNPGMREFQDDTSAEPEIAADTVDLVRIFRDILERARNRPVINVEEDSVTVGQMIQFLSRRLTMEDKPIALRRLLSHTRSERALIAIFLALLELVRLQAILLRQDLAFSEIFIKKHTGFEAVMNEGAASARDDWR